MSRNVSYGTCALCNKRFGKAGMGRHLAQCAPAHDSKRAKSARVYQIRVEGAWAREYWLDVEIKGQAKLLDLDGFLRGTWLECCGHLSAFRIGGVSYQLPIRELADDDPYARSMATKISRAVGPVGSRFTHEYDFGSTTELSLRVAGVREGSIGAGPIRLLARNEPIEWQCAKCEKPATWVCAECYDSGDPFFCQKHADEHECGEEALLPVVNSPRMGVCGYTGEDAPQFIG